MRKPTYLLSASLCMFALITHSKGFADSQDPEISNDIHTQSPSTEESFKPFTGKVTKNKVRLRLQPSLDGIILKELNREELLVVIGENDDFFAVQPPAETKAYVFRTLVLDNVVEGNKVNVRTEPDLEAPIIAQLNAGDRVEGSVSPLNSKWLEIAPPDSSRFYVCKEYVEKLGDPSLMSQLQRRRDDVNLLLNSTYLSSQAELEKSYDQMHLDTIIANYNRIIREYADFNEQASRAKELLAALQDNYLEKKIAYLEKKNAEQPKEIIAIATPKSDETHVPATIETTPSATPPSTISSTPDLNVKMSAWAAAEQSYYDQWMAKQEGNKSEEEFQQEEQQKTVSLRGVIEAYARPVKNKPGDYILVNRSNHLPIAYLYSTGVNLQERLGHEVTLRAVPRPNNNFAFPAYKVLSIE